MRRLLALSLILVTTAALGQEERGGYVGVGIGQLDYEDAGYRIDFSDTTTITKIYSGFRFSEKFAVEGYFSGSADIDSNVAGAIGGIVPNEGGPGFGGGVFTGNFSGDFDVLEVRVIAHTRRAYFALGLFSSDFEAVFSGNSVLGPFRTSISDSEGGYTLAIGLQWDLDNISIRGEYEYFDMSSPADATIIGASAHYRF